MRVLKLSIVRLVGFLVRWIGLQPMATTTAIPVRGFRAFKCTAAIAAASLAGGSGPQQLATTMQSIVYVIQMPVWPSASVVVK
mmetsp:Transcript_146335/g.266851  ORF Transcript_146335/g.266851 Transcript_146335/m.266851 type:complete len:83 (+) Transcript_146335:187-435(+)